MKKHAIIVLFCLFAIFPATVSAQEYASSSFKIVSDINSVYLEIIKAKTEVFCRNIKTNYFGLGWSRPSLVIYYSETASQAPLLTDQQSDNTRTSIYAHCSDANGNPLGCEILFHDIIYNYVKLSSGGVPEWFKQGLADFFAHSAQVVNDELVITPANSRYNKILKNVISDRRRVNIRRFFTTPSKSFKNWEMGRPFAFAFFYWLYETQQLKPYINEVTSQGFRLTALEKLTGKPLSKLNIELMNFIKQHCDAGAYLQEGLNAKTSDEKIKAFEKSIEMKPNYRRAQWQLAQLYLQADDLEKCREILEQILSDTKCSQYPLAAELMGNLYYKEKDYKKALEYYLSGWEHGRHYICKYKIAYQAANCYYYQKNKKETGLWYRRFLDTNWRHQKTKVHVAYAKKFYERVRFFSDE